MGANIRFRSLDDAVRLKCNILVSCRACDHVGVVDTEKAVRFFYCHHWNRAFEVAWQHFRCTACRGRADTFKPTPSKPTIPTWFEWESDWEKLVRRLRD